MAIAAPLSLYKTRVKPEWVDYNNHLNDGYYLVIFSLGGVDEFMNRIGMSDAERRATKTTIYTLEAHINYLREVKLDEEVEIRCQLIGFDQKRFQLYLTMHTARLGDELAATSEFMLVNIDSAGDPKSAPFRPEVAAKLAEVMEAHKALPLPAEFRARHRPAQEEVDRETDMDFGLTSEQQMLVDSIRAFVEAELKPHEEEVERTNKVRPELIQQIHAAAIKNGFYAANMPEELGGGGLDHVALTLMERELGRTSFALQYAVARPSNILRACQGEQIERYLLPAIRGERVECLGLTEPNAGSDLRSMQTRAEADGDDFVINGTKHFISYADVADFIVLFAASGVEETSKGVEEEDHVVPGRQGHQGPGRAHGPSFRVPSRLPPLRAGLQQLPCE